MKLKIILGSTSPRRKELLSKLGYPVQVKSPDFEEEIQPGESPEDYVLRNAMGKGASLLSSWKLDEAETPEFLVSADTVVVLDEETLEKPRDKNHASEMLAKLSGRSHKVYTGVSIWLHTKKGIFLEKSFRVETRVWFKTLNSEEIEKYIETGEPLDKAGSYGVQDRGAYLVKKIEGSYTSVMGLPLAEVAEVIQSKIF